MLGVTTTAAWAQHREFGERHAEERFHSPHWVYDTHHHLTLCAVKSSPHCRPQRFLWTSVVDITSSMPAFFFRPAGARFAVVAPPLGVVVPELPPAYATVWVGDVPYYYANDVYYSPAPGRYVVTAPPSGIEEAPETVAQAPAGSPLSHAASPPEPVVYPRSNQTPAITAADQSACNEWATTQEKANDPNPYQRAFAACMDGRGYSVR